MAALDADATVQRVVEANDLKRSSGEPTALRSRNRPDAPEGAKDPA
jgi:hypothetical protein